jgi:arginine deiminase
MEGGDVFIYTKDTLVIGVSDRTDIHAILTIAKALKIDKGNTFKQIIAINVPHEFELMHLDT